MPLPDEFYVTSPPAVTGSREYRWSFHPVMALDLQDGTLAGIAAFYAVVNIRKESLPLVFREMERVLQPGGLLLLACHAGDDILHHDELWGRPIAMDFFLFQPLAIRHCVEEAGLVIEEIIEREPYSPEVEYQSRRGYIFARKPGSLAQRWMPYRARH